METNRDFSELLSIFNAYEVRALVVGGYAFTFHVRPRYTKDLDVWIDPETENARRAWKALAAFGAPVSELTADDLATPGTVFQIGVPPNRVDVLTHLEGLTFEQAWSRRVASEYGGARIHVLGRDDLILNKRLVGRPQDLADVQALERLPKPS